MYLKPMRHHFEDYEQAEFDESKKLFGPMMNALCLVWANSEYYNTPARIIVLLQEMCNMIIQMVCSALNHLCLSNPAMSCFLAVAKVRNSGDCSNQHPWFENRTTSDLCIF